MKVGEDIVNFGRVNKIFDIKGETVYYKPYFEEPHTGGIICSIPLKSLEASNIRKPISKELCMSICKELKTRINIREYMDANDMTTLYNTNKETDLVRVLKLLNQESKEREHGLSTSKKTIFDKAYASFVQECAYARKTSIDEAEAFVNKYLN